MKPLQDDYPIVLSQDVIWGDMDAFGHVNNTVYFRYFEDARMAYFDAVNINEYKAKTNIGPILAHTDCNFKLPLKYPDKIHIAARAIIVAPKRIKMEYAVYSDNYSAIAAAGEGLIVYYDYSAEKSCEIPAELVAAINTFESN